MGMLVCMGATLKCTMGLAPSTLIVPPVNRVLAGGPPATNIMDNKPFANIPPFGMCISPSNPNVASKIPIPPPGVIKPQPCTSVTAAPWVPGSPTVLIGNMPALNNSSQLICSFGGVIQVLVPGQFRVMVP